MEFEELDNPLKILGINEVAIHETLVTNDLERLQKIAEATHKLLTKWFHPDTNPGIDTDYIDKFNIAINEIRDKELLSVYLDDFREGFKGKRQIKQKQKSEYSVSNLISLAPYVDHFALLRIRKPHVIAAVHSGVLSILTIRDRHDASLSSFNAQNIIDPYSPGNCIKYLKNEIRGKTKYQWKIFEIDKHSRSGGKWSSIEKIGNEYKNIRILGTVLMPKSEQKLSHAQITSMKSEPQLLPWLGIEDSSYVNEMKIFPLSHLAQMVKDDEKFGVVLAKIGTNQNDIRLSIMWNVVKMTTFHADDPLI